MNRNVMSDLIWDFYLNHELWAFVGYLPFFWEDDVLGTWVCQRGYEFMLYCLIDTCFKLRNQKKYRNMW